MPGIWRTAPLALRHYPVVLAAVAVAVGLAVASAASAPFVRAGVENASLRGQVRSLSPLAVGLERHAAGRAATDSARRAHAAAFGRSHGFSTRPVLTSRFHAQVPGLPSYLEVVVMARTRAVAHVTHTAGGGDGAWVSSALAGPLHLHPGSLLTLAAGMPPSFLNPNPPPTPSARVHLRVAGIYRALDRDLGDPYWANFVQDIRAQNPDSRLPPTFVLVPEQTLAHAAMRLGARVTNLFEYPVDPTGLTVAGAKRLQTRYAHAGGTSALGAALSIAHRDTREVASTISLLSACGLLVSLAVAAAAGAFLVRRREDEAQSLFACGESALVFGGRIAVESLLPAVIGAASGYTVALVALGLFAPAGTIDSTTLRGGAWAAALAGAVSVAAIALAATAAFPRRHDRAHPVLRRLRHVPWEVAPLAAAGVLLSLVLTGSGLAADSIGNTHPTLAVFLAPLLAAAGAAGLATRAARRVLRHRGGTTPIPVFLALRRLGAARGFLVAVVVTVATAVAVFTYGATLAASLDRAATEKAFVANGSDVQGVVDVHTRLLEALPFPVAVVHVDQRDASIGGRPLDIVSGDPARLASVVRWGDWPDDPRPRLRRLARVKVAAGTLPALASPGAPHVDAITYEGARIPVRIVARGPFPGMAAGRAALLVPATVLHAVAASHHVPDPGGGAAGLVWAKGDPSAVAPALARSSLDPVYLTMLDNVRNDASVVAGERSYRYLRAIGAIAAALALLALLLYLQARRRGQLVASALTRRMGLAPIGDAAALALEAAAVVAAAGALGVGVAAGAAAVIVSHVDPLPQYAPGTMLVYPWTTFLWVGTVAVGLAAAFAAAAAWAGGRSAAAEALRVA